MGLLGIGESEYEGQGVDSFRRFREIIGSSVERKRVGMRVTVSVQGVM